MAARTGTLALVLHSHLPFIKHPEHEQFLEEKWLFEAMLETYLPLLDALYRLEADGVRVRLTVSLTPPLCQMLEDPLLNRRFRAHVDSLMELLDKEIERVRGDERMERVVQFYRERFGRLFRLYSQRLQGNVLNGYRHFADIGYIEIITCAATHGFLPNLQTTPASVRAQVQLARRSHERMFGRDPQGIWLPECAYYEGVEEHLRDAGIRYFLTDTHGILFSRPRALYGNHAPVYTPNGLAVFARDQESSRQVWSSEVGYPGDHRYREFYRDVGWDLEYDYIRPYINPDGNRVFVGLKYYRITGSGDCAKEPYDPGQALEAAASHAAHFLRHRREQANYLQQVHERAPLIVCPYDAELFGHWWFEGIDFLEILLRQIHFDQDEIEVATLGGYLQQYPEHQVVRPAPSTWGARGYNEVWLNQGNDWIYKYLHECSYRMTEWARRYAEGANALQERVLNQMGRELVLMESSDWAFLITTQTAADYSTRRTVDHIQRFERLESMLRDADVDVDFLEETEFRDSILTDDMDYRLWIP